MARILVVTIGTEEGSARLRHKSFEVINETRHGYVVRNTKKSPLLDGKELVKRSELERIVFTDVVEAKAVIHIDAETVDKALVRQWYKVLREEAMSRLRKQNLALKQMFKEVEGLAI